MRNDVSHGVDRNDIFLSRRQLVTGSLAVAIALAMLSVSALGLDNQPAPSGVLNIGAAEVELIDSMWAEPSSEKN